MKGAHLDIVQRFSGAKVTVIGDIILDCYIEANTKALCREAPVPIFDVAAKRCAPGGAANAAANLKALGADVSLVYLRGDDSSGDSIASVLNTLGIWDYGCIAPGIRTLTKTRFVADSQIILRFDEGGGKGAGASHYGEIMEILFSLFPHSDAILLSDYSGALINRNMLSVLEHLQKEHKKLLVVDSRFRLSQFARLRPTLVKPNFEEAVSLLGNGPGGGHIQNRIGFISRYGEEIRIRSGASIVAVTLDKDGAMVFEGRKAEPYRTFSKPVQQRKAAGAGDTYLSGFLLALLAGSSVQVAADIASAAASVVTSREGTIQCSGKELLQLLGESDKVVSGRAQLIEKLRSYRNEKRRIVFTNGCFDILHAGNIYCLNRAKEMGDILIVGVNSDESVRRIKGEGRPINKLEDRVKILGALSYVDHIVPFDQDTACELVGVIKPDVFIKGSDHEISRLPEVPVVAAYGGEVRIVPLIEEQSTTRIIEQIQGRALSKHPHSMLFS